MSDNGPEQVVFEFEVTRPPTGNLAAPGLQGVISPTDLGETRRPPALASGISRN